jgi:hypothetical protein
MYPNISKVDNKIDYDDDDTSMSCLCVCIVLCIQFVKCYDEETQRWFKMWSSNGGDINCHREEDQRMSKLLQLQQRRRQHLSSRAAATSGSIMWMSALFPVDKHKQICDDYISGVGRNHRLLSELAFPRKGTPLRQHVISPCKKKKKKIGLIWI